MSYRDFIKRLNKGIEGRVKGYFDEDEGCLLYLSRHDTIFVAAMLIEKRTDEVLMLLQDAIRTGLPGRHAVAVVDAELCLRPVDNHPGETSS